MNIEPTQAPAGAEITGLDLRQPLRAEQVEQIKDLLADRGVICFRGQQLTPAQHAGFTRQFGTLQPYDPKARFRLPEAPDVTVLSNIYENGEPVGIIEAGQYWHSDMPYAPEPPYCAALYAVEVPRDPEGRPLGGTMFISTAHAFDSLAPELRQRIDGLRALHCRNKRSFSATRLGQRNEYDGDGLQHVHPVVRRHPRTGRKCLYVNETYTTRLLDLGEEESAALLAELCRHATREAARYTHRWNEGDLLMWDDCAVQHHAVNDYALPLRRRVHRAVVAGLPPC